MARDPHPRQTYRRQRVLAALTSTPTKTEVIAETLGFTVSDTGYHLRALADAGQAEPVIGEGWKTA